LFKKRLSLFWTFFKIGAFTFGGGYAMIPLIRREIVETRGWMKDEDILDIIAISESTPGPIAVNSATFVGRRVGGVAGAACATLGVVLPSFIIISLIALILEQFQALRAVRYAFYGIRAGVLALLVKAVWLMFSKCPKGVVAYIVMALALLVSVFTKINLIFIIAGCALIGLISSLVFRKGAEK